MGEAIIDVSCELLADCLYLPRNASVLYSLQPVFADTVRLVVESPDIPETQDLNEIPILAPTFRREQVPSTVTLINWGLP